MFRSELSSCLAIKHAARTECFHLMTFLGHGMHDGTETYTNGFASGNVEHRKILGRRPARASNHGRTYRALRTSRSSKAFRIIPFQSWRSALWFGLGFSRDRKPGHACILLSRLAFGSLPNCSRCRKLAFDQPKRPGAHVSRQIWTEMKQSFVLDPGPQGWTFRPGRFGGSPAVPPSRFAFRCCESNLDAAPGETGHFWGGGGSFSLFCSNE